MKQWIKENKENIVFGIQALTFCTFFLAFVFGGLIVGALLAG